MKNYIPGDTLATWVRRNGNPLGLGVAAPSPVALSLSGTITLANVGMCAVSLGKNARACRAALKALIILGIEKGWPFAASWWNASVVPLLASKGIAVGNLPLSVNATMKYLINEIWPKISDSPVPPMIGLIIDELADAGVPPPPSLVPATKAATSTGSSEGNTGWWVVGGLAIAGTIAAIVISKSKKKRRR